MGTASYITVMADTALIQPRAMAQAACCKEKKHMLSLTWNAPIEAFTREGDFFEGKGVDVLYMHFHKLNEFLGLTRLPTFLCNDVVKVRK